MRPLSEIATNLERSPEGLWTARSISPVSYPETGNDFYFSLEAQSFWFRHRNHCILQAMRKLPPSGAIFDVGGGNGFVAQALQDAGHDVVLVEPGSGAQNAQRRGLRCVVHAAFEDAGFLPHSLPAAGLFDVLEHTAEDRLFLAALVRALAPGGRLYLTVPAGKWLWSREDIADGHYRRYSLSGLTALLSAASLDVEFATCFFGFLPIPLLLRRALPFRLGLVRKDPAPDRVRAQHIAGGLTGRFLDVLAARELRRIDRGRVIRFGTSCLAVARKS